MRFLAFILIFAATISARGATADAELDPALAECLPFHASLSSAFAPVDGSAVIAAGTPFVLVRVEGDLAVADVSRRGVFRLPLAQTDVLAQARATRAALGDARPELSRMVFFIGNKLVGGDSGWEKPVPAAMTHGYRSWVLVYADAAEASAQTAVRAIEAVRDDWPETTRSRVGIVFMERNGSEEALRALAAETRPRISAMSGFLSKGYVRSFAHLNPDETGAVFVLTDAAGTVLARHVGAEPGAKFWAECARAR